MNLLIKINVYPYSKSWHLHMIFSQVIYFFLYLASNKTLIQLHAYSIKLLFKDFSIL